MLRSLFAKAALVMAALTLALVLVGWAGIRAAGSGSETARSLAEHRAGGIALLKEMSDLYAVNVVDAAHKARNGNQPMAASLATVVTAQGRIAEIWREFQPFLTTDADRRIADAVESTSTAAAAATAELREILAAGDAARLDAFVVDRLYPAIDPTTEEISLLITAFVQGAEDSYRSYLDEMSFLGMLKWGIAVYVVLTLAAGGYVAAGMIFGPLNRLTATMSRAANGDLDVVIEGIEARDEIGAMARATASFVATARQARSMEAEARDRGEMQARRAAALEDAIRRFREASSRALSAVGAEVDGMIGEAGQLTTVSAQAEQRASTTSVATEEATNGVQSVASATEELSASIGEIAGQVAQARDRIRAAATQADVSARDIDALEDNVKHIDTVMALIRSIAEQTNLLALNATIEAARAGEHGRGFAVVASEVKNLAQRTASATDEIAERISAIQHSTGTTARGVREIADRMGDVERYASGIATAVEQQTMATNEISGSASSASAGIAETAASVAGVADIAARTRKSADQMTTKARLVASRRAELETAIESFLEAVAAGDDRRAA